ncbi:MAG TPA: hypothetical protein VGP36_25295 [Mycobacteriales bacterium]|nr:hypothetical protein [Mycobacteriales bacterium]
MMLLLPGPRAVLSTARSTASALLGLPRRALTLAGRVELAVDRVDALLDAVAAIATRADLAATRAAGVVGRADEVATDAALLVTRADTVAASAAVLVGRADSVASDADRLVTRADGVAGDAALLVSRADTVAGNAAGVVDRAGSVAETAAGVVERAGGVAGTAAGVVDQAGSVAGRAAEVVGGAGETERAAAALLAAYRPVLEDLRPIVDRLVQTVDPHEVEAMVALVDRLPRLADSVDTDILPLLSKLNDMAPDLHALLEAVDDLRSAVAGLPGIGRLMRRGDDQLADPEARPGEDTRGATRAE